jgi:hypothetical protein
LKWLEQDLSLVSVQDRGRTAANKCNRIPSWIVSPSQSERGFVCAVHLRRKTVEKGTIIIGMGRFILGLTYQQGE